MRECWKDCHLKDDVQRSLSSYGILYHFVPGLMYCAKVVAKGTEKDVLAEFHGSAFGGYNGVNRTTEAIQKRYWWKGLTEDVKVYVRSCMACQKSDPLKPAKKPELQQIKDFPSLTTAPEATDAYVQNRQKETTEVRNRVEANVGVAQKRQKADYKKRTEKGRHHDILCVGDVVLSYNIRKKITKRKSNLQANYEGAYTIVDIKGKLATLTNNAGKVLKTKMNVDRLKLFKHHQLEPCQQNTEANEDHTSSKEVPEESCPAQNEERQPPQTEIQPDHPEIDQYLEEIKQDGSLQKLIDFTSNLQLTKPTNLPTLMSRLMIECPIQSFICEVTKEFEEKMEQFSTRILPNLRNLNVTISEKTTLTMIVSAVCCRSMELYQPVTDIAQTLVGKPVHLLQCEQTPEIGPADRLSVGGETVEAADLKTLDNGHWLNDKLISAFLGLLKSQVNPTVNKIFVLPSYTAVLWDAGNIGHWLFKKVQFLKFKYVLIPINVNANHWVLLVANVKDRTVSILDSMFGNCVDRYIDLWSQHMQIRDLSQDVKDVLGSWTEVKSITSRQTDGRSCGVFVQMNSECIARDVATSVMRQVHCPMFRKYVKTRLVQGGVTKKEDVCDFPDCKKRRGTQRWIQCCVCGRWFHTRCVNISTKTAIEDDYECVFCSAMYN